LRKVFSSQVSKLENAIPIQNSSGEPLVQICQVCYQKKSLSSAIWKIEKTHSIVLT